MSVLLELIIIPISFFDFWVSIRIKEGRRVLSLAMQFLFIFIFTLPIGLFVSVSLYVFGGLAKTVKILPLQGVLLVTLLLSSILFMVVVLNIKDRKYNLPDVILTKLLILVNLKSKKEWFGIGEALIFICASTIGLSFLIAYIIDTFFPLYLDMLGAIYIIIFSLLVSVFVFSEATDDKAERAVRQSILWLLLFIVLTIAACYQLKDLLDDISKPQTQVNMVLLVFGLVFNISTIADKVRLFFDESEKSLGENLKLTRAELHNHYSFSEDISSAKQVVIEFAKLWRKGTFKEKCKLLVFTIILPLAVCILMIVLSYMTNQFLGYAH